MRLATVRRRRGTATAIASLVSALLVPLACSGGSASGAPRVVEASLLTAVLLGGPLLVIVVAVVALLRRRRGPEPLSRMLLAGSLREMQGPRPYRRPSRP